MFIPTDYTINVDGDGWIEITHGQCFQIVNPPMKSANLGAVLVMVDGHQCKEED